MGAHDHDRKVYVLLAAGVFVTALIGVVVGYGNIHPVVPREVQHMDTTANEPSFGCTRTLKKSPGIDKQDWLTLRLPLFSIPEDKTLLPDQADRWRSKR